MELHELAESDEERERLEEAFTTGYSAGQADGRNDVY